MNKKRRNVLNSVLDGLAKLRDPTTKENALDILIKAHDKVQECADDEENALDSRPEAFKWSATNDEMNENVSDLYDASSDLEVLIEECGDAEVFSYTTIKSDVVNIVNKIKQTINR